MKKTKSRILSLLLTACMVLTLLPAAALATNPDAPAPGVEETVPLLPLTPAEPTPAPEEETVPMLPLLPAEPSPAPAPGEEDTAPMLPLTPSGGAAAIPADMPVPLADTRVIYVTAEGDDSKDGTTTENAVKSLSDAYGKVAAGGEIRVLSDLDVTATAFNAAKAVTIQSYNTDGTTVAADEPWTLTRKVTDAELFTVNNASGSVTMKNIILDGGGAEATKTMLHVYNGAVVLGEGVVIENHVITGQHLNLACATPSSENATTSLTIDGAVIRGNMLDDGTGSAGNPNGILGAGSGGKVIITSGEITGNTLENTAVVVAIGSAGAPSFTMSGGKITGNTLASGVAAVYMRGTAAAAAFNFSGDPVVYDNKNGLDEQRNVYLNNTAATGSAYLYLTGALTGDAKIGVYAKTMPTATAKLVDVAIGKDGYAATQSDANCFFSDKATGAGITLSGNKVVLDYDARVIVNTDVTLDESGTASITIHPTTEGAHYAILDKNGAVIELTVTGGTAAGSDGWYTAGGSGAMTFSGLEPANGPYRVVTTSNSTAAPNGNSSATNNTLVGDLVEFLYVKSDGEDTAAGTREAPRKTLAGAYTAAESKAAGTICVVLVMDNLTAEPALNIARDVTIIITSETATTRTITRKAGGALITSNSANASLTLKNITLDGNKAAAIESCGPLVAVAQGNVVLDAGTTLQNNKNNDSGNFAFGGGMMLRGSFDAAATATVKAGATIQNNEATWGGGIHANYGKAALTIEGGKISGNKAYATEATDNSGRGGGVSLYGSGTPETSATVHIKGGAITGNEAELFGGGVFATNGGTLNLSGSVTVSQNTLKGNASNVYLGDEQTITITGRVTGNVGVYVEKMPTADKRVVAIATGAQNADTAAFHSDKESEAGIVFNEENSQVVLSYDARARVEAKVDKAGQGQLTVTTAAGTQYYINDAEGKVPDGVVAYDKDGKVVAPDADGWYQTSNGPLTFKPLELAKKYQVCSKAPGQTGNTGWDEDRAVEIPVVGDNLYAKPGGEDNTTTIVIDPADKKIKYAVLDKDGNQVYPAATNDPAKDWIFGTGDKIVIELPNLDSGETYQVVGVPIGDETAKPTDKKDSGETVVTPPATIQEVGTPGNGDQITRVPDTDHAGKDKIIIKPTLTDQEYSIYNPKTGETMPWQAGTGENGAALEFHPLEPGVDYQVVTRTKDTDNGTDGDQPSIPTQGVTVPKNPSLDSITGKTETNGTETTDDDATITINPTDPALDYGIVDKDGNPVSGLEGWMSGSGGSVSFPGLKPGDGYIIVTKPSGAENPAKPGDAIGGLPVITPVAPTPAPNEDGGATGDTQAKREPNADKTDNITIPAKEATSGYKFALRDEDGNYYKQDGTLNDPATTPVYVTGESKDIVFNNLPMGKDYEIVKLPAAEADPVGAIQIPSVTPVPKLPPMVLGEHVTTGIEKDGDAVITVNPADKDYNYLLTDSTGKVLQIKPGNDGSITFPNLMPGEEYTVVTEKKDKETPTQVGETADTVRGTDVETPVLKDNAITGGKDTTNPGKTQIVIDPTSDEVKYVVTDSDGKVVAVAPGTDGKLVIGGLDQNKEYTVSTVPKDAVTPAVGDTGYDPTEPNVTVKTPTTGTSDIPGAKPAITTGTGSITINPTVNGKVYEVVDPGTGEVVGTVTGDGNSITIDGLQSGKEYVVQVKDDVSNAIPVILDKVTTPGGGGGSTGGSSSSSNATVNKPNGGTVTVNPKNPKPGDKVTITVKPDEGFTTDKVVVKTTPGGKEVELTDNGDGTYTYTQPKEKVTIDATFKKVTGDPDSNGVSGLLDTVNHMAYLNGNDAGNFAPTADMTRAEVAQMFYNLLKNKDTNLGNKASFSDVSAEAWYATAVNTLANIGILNGRGDGSYDPEASITRAEFVSIATRFAAKTTGSKTYTDVTADHWAAEAIRAASYYGWIGGYGDGTFKPTANIARSEAVKVVNAMLGRSADKAFIDKAEGLKTFPDVPKTDWAYYPIMEATNAHDFDLKDGTETWKSK